jgi:hypothetical protein
VGRLGHAAHLTLAVASLAMVVGKWWLSQEDGGEGATGPTCSPQSQTMLYIICATQKQCRKLWNGLSR